MDIHTFEKLFKDNYESLYYHAISYINDSETAKDIVNDVFEYIWANRSKWNMSYSVKPLLYKMTQSNCINHIRHKEVKRKYQDFKINRNELFDENFDEYEALIEKLITTIENFPEQNKLIFKKCFLDGKRYKEVADELGISINTVKTHITKSLKKLRGDFKDELILYFFFLEKKQK